MEEKNNFKSREKFWTVIIIAIIFGFLAGFLGQLVSGLYFLSNFGLPLVEGGITTFISKEEKASRLGQFFNYEVTEDLGYSLVGIYPKKNTGQDVLSQIYLPSELMGQGIILTSDGWILTSQSVVKNLTASQLVVIFEQKSYLVDKLIVDTISGGIFLHTLKDDNKNWPVAKLTSQPEDLKTGQSVLAINNSGEITTSNIKNLNYQPIVNTNQLIQSADSFSTNILIKDEMTDSYLGAPLISLTGEVIGLIQGVKSGLGTIVIPSFHLESIIGSVLKDEEIKRPYLGVNYIDLAQVVGVNSIQDLSEHQLRRGALVYSVKANSPAAKAGLRKEDIILKIDDEQVNHQKNLTSLIQEFNPGKTIRILFLRQGVDQEINLVLGEQ